MKYDAIVIGSGPAGMAKGVELCREGLKCLMVGKGVSVYGFAPEEFLALGGELLKGDEVVSASVEGNEVKAVFTANLEGTPLCADRYYLATGKFFAGGLKSDMNRVYEPIFGIDVDYIPDSSAWFSERFADDQPFMHFAVKTTEEGQAVKEGNVITNLFPIGEIIEK